MSGAVRGAWDLKSGVLRRVSGEVLAARCRVAGSYFSRVRGLLGRASLGEDEALMIPKCRSVHTHGMRFPIDIVYVDHRMRVVAALPSVGPWRSPRRVKRAEHVIEAAAGSVDRWQLAPGDLLELVAAPAEPGMESLTGAAGRAAP